MPIKQFQWNLLVMGYYGSFDAKHADGQWGKGSVKALHEFQKDNNLPITDMFTKRDIDKSMKLIRDFQLLLGMSKAEADGLGGPRTLALRSGSRPTPAPKPAPTKPDPPKPSAPIKPVTDWSKIKHFKKQEFACKCGGKYCNGFPVQPNVELAELLENIRAHFNRPVIITSGIRCEKHNAAVGGAPGSKHKEGIAADIVVQGVPSYKVADYAEKLLQDKGGIGRYPNFTHVDVRTQKARWQQ